MYSDWESLVDDILNEAPTGNVLKSFPSTVGKDVVHSILKPLVDVTISQTNTAAKLPLSTSEQVHWTMQVIGHGFTLPLSENALIASCIDVYDMWLTALHTPKSGVPGPILEDPDHYAQIIFEQLPQLFMTRKPDTPHGLATSSSHLSTATHNHAILCNRVIQIIHQTIRHGNAKFSRETWQTLFKFLLNVVDVSLSPPPDTNGLGVTLCSSLIHVLFEAWLCACIACFPSPPLWKTLRELCCNWLHHNNMVKQWNKVIYSLTLRVVKHLYSAEYLFSVQSSLPKEDRDFKTILDEMPSAVLVQCWFRMLHTIGNPAEVSYPSRMLNLPAFQKAVIELKTSTHKPKHQQHLNPVEACLKNLPGIFKEAMIGVSTLVYLFLAHSIPAREITRITTIEYHGSPLQGRKRRESQDSRQTPQAQGSTGLPAAAKKSKWYVSPVSSLPNTVTQGLSTTSLTPPLAKIGEVSKPKGNTLLHLFGGWLFEAAIWPWKETELEWQSQMKPVMKGGSTSFESISDFEDGRAEAIGALCSIFSSQSCGEPFLPIYLARFYKALAVGLNYDEKSSRGQMLTKIILNSSGLLRKDLKGIHIVVPHFLSALELILPRPEVDFRCYVDTCELRKSSIGLLLSMLSLPLHFLDQPLSDLSKFVSDPQTPTVTVPAHSDSTSTLPTPELSSQSSFDTTDFPPPPTTLSFLCLKDRLLHLIFSAIESESDPVNVQMLLHGLMVFIQDIVCYENSVLRMMSDDVSGPDVSSTSKVHIALGPTLSNASVYSFASTQVSTSFSLPTLFEHAIKCGSQCLMSWGENNVQVSLAVLELIGGLSELQIEDITHSDCQLAVISICKFIQYQAMKDPTQHNKDLHTSIVAALRVLMMWINGHPYLLGNKEPLTAVMEVIELGISGSVSAATDETVIYKGDKELKPLSYRVKEVAEYMLSCVMETGAFPSCCGAEASSSLLAEEDILARLPQEAKDGAKFRYFVMDNSVILGFLEEPFTRGEDAPLPTVTAVVRSLTGRHVWSMQLRHSPRSDEQLSNKHHHSMPRPPPITPTPVPLSSLERRPWPEEVNLEPHTNVDQCLPDLEDVIDDEILPLHTAMLALTSQQVDQEVKVHSEQQRVRDSMPYPDPRVAMEPPEVKQSFNTARLFLSHLGMLGIENVKDHPVARYPSLMMLESNTNFRSSLCRLDRLPSRYCNTVFVLYLKEGTSKLEDILISQKSLIDKPAEYIEFLHGLGWIVDPLSHPGFAGRIRQPKTTDIVMPPIGLSAEIPYRPFPYYADVTSEVAFINPTLKPSSSDSITSIRSTGSSDSSQDISYVPHQHGEYSSASSLQHPLIREPQGCGVSESTAQAESSKSLSASMSGGRKLGSKADLVSMLDTPPRTRRSVPQDCAAIVVWLEKFEDHLSFPLETLSSILHGGSLAVTGSQKMTLLPKRALPVIFIHMLSSGLFQITTKNPFSRLDCLAGPLIDGMVVSRRTLSMLVRQTTMNMCHRHRMENEGYSPPHVNRKRKIEEITNTFGTRLSVADFYYNLISQKEPAKKK